MSVYVSLMGRVRSYMNVIENERSVTSLVEICWAEMQTETVKL